MDYNLFPVFVEIMKHQNISKAAAALGMTQPAASNALGRLRQQLGDPLFIRASRGVIPTQFASSIADEMEHHVEQLRGLAQSHNREAADLSKVKRRLKIITHDMEECLILPILIPKLATEAPNIQLEISPYNRTTFGQELLTNQADIVMAYLTDIHKNLMSKELLYQDFICVSRSNHPDLKKGLSLEKFIALPHALVSPDKGGFRGLVDQKLKEMGHSRHVTISAPHFLTCCQMVAASSHLLTLPRQVALLAAKLFNLKTYELPFELGGFSTSIHWHRRLDRDAEHQAIRSFIMKLVQSHFH